MAKTLSTMLPLGTQAPDFSLPDTRGQMVTLKDFQGAPALLVVFMCNHCPYVKHIRTELATFAREYMGRRVAIVGINANDVQNFPDDRPELMAVEAQQAGYPFPYLYDETQSVAKAYRAACTPDFFLFDGQRRLVYRGQFDDSRPRVEHPLPVTGNDLRGALDAVLAGKPLPAEQKPSLGCNIKWKPGNEPEYY